MGHPEIYVEEEIGASVRIELGLFHSLVVNN